MKKIALMLLLTGTLLFSACSSGDQEAFTYSSGIDENGYWKGITAKELVELPSYKGIEIPAEIHTVSQEDVDAQVASLLDYYTKEDQIKDRAVVSGDKVNIDYVGTVAGVAFEGGDTEGNGTDVVIGETQYIDDFLDQIIGKRPGETFDILVTFPTDYGVENLNGKDAVFRTTVNYIAQSIPAERTDAFVLENLYEAYGWSTVKEMEEGLKTDLQDAAVMAFIQDFITNNAKVEKTPASMITYQENSMIQYYTEYAKNSGMELDAFLSAYAGVENMDALIASSKEQNTQAANYFLILQAIAEEADLQVSQEDVSNYFMEYMNLEDYSEIETQYGMPFIKMSVLQQKVLDLLTDQAVLS
jgi:trigger factor